MDEYRCPYCGNIFAETKTIVMTHGLDTPPYEEWSVCPNCKEPVCVIDCFDFCSNCKVKLPVGTEVVKIGDNLYCPDCYDIKTL